jgi:hypothetical protein
MNACVHKITRCGAHLVPRVPTAPALVQERHQLLPRRRVEHLHARVAVEAAAAVAPRCGERGSLEEKRPRAPRARKCTAAYLGWLARRRRQTWCASVQWWCVACPTWHVPSRCTPTASMNRPKRVREHVCFGGRVRACMSISDVAPPPPRFLLPRISSAILCTAAQRVVTSAVAACVHSFAAMHDAQSVLH